MSPASVSISKSLFRVGLNVAVVTGNGSWTSSERARACLGVSPPSRDDGGGVSTLECTSIGTSLVVATGADDATTGAFAFAA